MHYVLDDTWRRIGPDVLAGSPLRFFRLSQAGERVADSLARGDDVADSSLTDRLLDAGAIHPRLSGRSRFTIDDVTVVTPSLDTPVRRGRLTIDDASERPIEGAALRLGSNRGPGGARNAARPLITTPLVAFVDADVDLPEGDDPTAWLTPLLGHFDDPRVGLVAPRVAGEHGSALDCGDRPARIRASSRVSYVPAAAIVVRVEAFDAMGGFDETLRLGEDVDFVWRLDDAGWRCRYEPSSVVWHQPRESRIGRLRQHFAYGRSAAALALRHPRDLAPWHADPATAASWAALFLGRPGVVVALQRANLRRLRHTLSGVPSGEITRLVAEGQLSVTGHLAGALRREWFPLAFLAALVSRRARLGLALAFALAPRNSLSDAAYGVGVWRGAVERRTALPLLPRIQRWDAEGRRPSPAAHRTGLRSSP